MRGVLQSAVRNQENLNRDVRCTTSVTSNLSYTLYPKELVNSTDVHGSHPVVFITKQITLIYDFCLTVHHQCR